jgi:hypothetical protein
MVKKKILIIGVYPIKRPQHGGQKRLAAIVELYKKVFSEVKFVAIFPPDYYQVYDRSDIAVKGATRKKTTDSPYTGDIICGLAIHDDPKVRKRMEKLLLSFRPDIIQCEQVFPYFGLKPLLEELDLHPKIVQSSQNIEYIQKLEILSNAGYAEAKEASNLIKKWETDMSTTADLSVAVSPEDAEKLAELGAKHPVVAPNGIAKHHVTQADREPWVRFRKEQRVTKIATFVGSAHPPNWFGFLATIGDRVGFMPPDARIILAGSISDYFHDTFIEKKLRPEFVTFWNRVHAAGRVSDDALYGLIDSSDIILLPITEGGGSNLKTAEAILSGRKVVGTSYAFRSFEQYMDLPNVYVADTPKAFRETLLKAFDAPFHKRTKEQEALAERVQWDYCLEPMVEGVKAL